jgi:hypothetical protein
MAAPTRDPEMPDAERIDYLRGQVHSMFSLFLTLIEMTPDLEDLQRRWVAADDFQEADTLPSLVSEQYRAGQFETRTRIAALIGVAKSKRARGA